MISKVLIAVTLAVFVQLAFSTRYYIGENGHCDSNPDKCTPGTSCVGPRNQRRCKKLMGVNKQCERDPWWFCQEGLVCENKVCKIPGGESCTQATDGCASGLSCVGSRSNKKCVHVVGAGKKCDVNTFKYCGKNLSCEEDYCRIPRYGYCNNNLDDCAEGLYCVGPSGKERCNKLMPVNGKCKTDPWWFCQKGVVCENDVCKLPEGASCMKFRDGCAAGLGCVGGGNNKKCKKLGAPGDICLEKKSLSCQSNLVCEKKRCRIPVGGSCRKYMKSCVADATCNGHVCEDSSEKYW